jgi:hypothetical protein
VPSFDAAGIRTTAWIVQAGTTVGAEAVGDGDADGEGVGESASVGLARGVRTGDDRVGVLGAQPAQAITAAAARQPRYRRNFTR